MSKKERKKLEIQTVKDVTGLGQISKKDLIAESIAYELNNYSPLEHLNEKEVLNPKHKSEVITIRLTTQENSLITHLADENGLSKSAFVRMVVKRALKETEYR